jgi:glutaredoxin
MKFPVALLLIMLVTGASYVDAQTAYKWVDKDGKVSYQDRPPPEGSQYTSEPTGIITGEVAENPAEKFPIVMYTTKECASCDQARDYLKARKVPFREIAVADPKLREELLKKTGSLIVPTIFVGEHMMKGYIESLVEGELDHVGYPRPASPEKTSEDTPVADVAVTPEAVPEKDTEKSTENEPEQETENKNKPVDTTQGERSEPAPPQ